jgi:peroxiredoxin Q/BCP
MKRTLTFVTFCLVAVMAWISRPAVANPEDFSVPSATSEATFKLSEAKGKYVALHFLLKTECPYCLAHTRKYFTEASKLPNVLQVFLKPDSVEEIKAWAGKLPAEDLAKYPIYRDADAKLADEFGIPGGYQFHGQVVHYPALVLLGPDGKEVFRYIGKSNADRFSFDQLKAKVAELEKKG